MELKNLIEWEKRLQDIEKVVANQIITKITDFKKSDKWEPPLLTLMKKYSVRAVFEACFRLENSDVTIKGLDDKCDDVIQKNKERFK